MDSCGCENLHCEHCRAEGCDGEGVQGCMFVGYLCAACAEFMPDEYLIDD